MKKVIKFSVILFILCISTTIYGASFFLSGSKSLEKGKTTTYTVNTDLTGRVNISSSNNSIASVSKSSEWMDGANITFTVTAKDYGTATIKVVAVDPSDKGGNDLASITKTIALNVPKPPEKSSNNNLKSLYTGYYLAPAFNKSKTYYTMTVPETVYKIKVSAKAEDNRAKVYVSGDTNLKVGRNNVYITVTAENGSKKTYQIAVNKTSNPELANAYLDSMAIEGFNIDFDKGVFEYNLGNVSPSMTNLNITAYTEYKNASFVIEGNELKEGDNTVKVIVTAANKSTKLEYLIKLYKEKKATFGTEEIDLYYYEPEVDIYDVDIYKGNNSYDIKATFLKIWNFIKRNAITLGIGALALIEAVYIGMLNKKIRKRKEVI